MESLVLFDSVVNSRWFMRTSIILFLNKVDLFKQKLSRSPLSNYFPDYSGGNDVNRAAKYLLWRFNQVNRAHLNLYPQYVTTISYPIPWHDRCWSSIVSHKLPIPPISALFSPQSKKQFSIMLWRILAYYDPSILISNNFGPHLALDSFSRLEEAASIFWRLFRQLFYPRSSIHPYKSVLYMAVSQTTIDDAQEWRSILPITRTLDCIIFVIYLKSDVASSRTTRSCINICRLVLLVAGLALLCWHNGA